MYFFILLKVSLFLIFLSCKSISSHRVEKSEIFRSNSKIKEVENNVQIYKNDNYFYTLNQVKKGEILLINPVLYIYNGEKRININYNDYEVYVNNQIYAFDIFSKMQFDIILRDFSNLSPIHLIVRGKDIPLDNILNFIEKNDIKLILSLNPCDYINENPTNKDILIKILNSSKIIGLIIFLYDCYKNIEAEYLITQLEDKNKIYGIELSFDKISENFISNIKDFNNLKLLKILYRKMNDISFLNELKNLEYLEFYKLNFLSNPIEQINQLSKLKVLIIRNEDIERKLNDLDLEQIYNLINLEILDLSNNNLTDECLNHIAKLGNLNTLILSENKIKGFKLGLLKNLNKLKYLDLSRNEITDDGLENFNSHDNLSHINLGSNKIAIGILRNIDKFPSLKELNLEGNEIDDNSLEYIKVNETLEEIVLRSNKIEGLGIIYLKNLKNIKEIDLSHNKINNKSLEKIYDKDLNFSKLEYLDLSHNKLNGTMELILFFEKLFNIGSLKTLNLSYNSLGLTQHGKIFEEFSKFLEKYRNKIEYRSGW